MVITFSLGPKEKLTTLLRMN